MGRSLVPAPYAFPFAVLRLRQRAQCMIRALTSSANRSTRPESRPFAGLPQGRPRKVFSIERLPLQNERRAFNLSRIVPALALPKS